MIMNHIRKEHVLIEYLPLPGITTDRRLIIKLDLAIILFLKGEIHILCFTFT